MRTRVYSGFTLLELLIVIAIIGLLAAVVVVALSSSRGRSQDAAIIAQLDQAKKEAALYFLQFNRYCSEMNAILTGECWSGELSGGSAYCNDNYRSVFDNVSTGVPNTIGRFIEAALVQAPGGSAPQCFSDAVGSTYALTIPLHKAPNTRWCVDSNGAAEEVAGDDTTVSNAIIAAGMLCP